MPLKLHPFQGQFWVSAAWATASLQFSDNVRRHGIIGNPSVLGVIPAEASILSASASLLAVPTLSASANLIAKSPSRTRLCAMGGMAWPSPVMHERLSFQKGLAGSGGSRSGRIQFFNLIAIIGGTCYSRLKSLPHRSCQPFINRRRCRSHEDKYEYEKNKGSFFIFFSPFLFKKV